MLGSLPLPSASAGPLVSPHPPFRKSAHRPRPRISTSRQRSSSAPQLATLGSCVSLWSCHPPCPTPPHFPPTPHPPPVQVCRHVGTRMSVVGGLQQRAAPPRAAQVHGQDAQACGSALCRPRRVRLFFLRLFPAHPHLISLSHDSPHLGQPTTERTQSPGRIPRAFCATPGPRASSWTTNSSIRRSSWRKLPSRARRKLPFSSRNSPMFVPRGCARFVRA